MTYLYIIHAESTNFYKIGITKDLDSRLSAINNTSPYKCYILLKKEFDNRKDALEFENKVHRKFNKKRMNGEWFSLELNDLENVKDYIKKPISKLDEVFVCANNYFNTKEECISCGEKIIPILHKELGIDVSSLRVSIKSFNNKFVPFIYLSISDGAYSRYLELAFFISLKYDCIITNELSNLSIKSIKIECTDKGFTFCINKNSIMQIKKQSDSLPTESCSYCGGVFIKSSWNQKYCSKKCKAQKKVDELREAYNLD